jgi:N,N'-diacetyllegionaminate synthase
MLEERIMRNGVVVIAEIGMTHDGSFGLAKNIVRAAIEAGADVIKFQWHIADAETLASAPTPPYFQGERRIDYFRRTEFTLSQFMELVELCRCENVIPCVSIFSQEALALALTAGFDVIKIPSGEVSNLPLLEEIAASSVDVICSSGMSNWSELDEAIRTLRSSPFLAVLQCTSLYPTPAERVGLNVIGELRDRYGIPCGLSDHTLNSATAIAAVAMGARIVEKHFTLSKKMYGPDAQFSLEPDEFRQLVNDIRYVAAALKSPIDKSDVSSFGEMRLVFQKSIVAARDIAQGEILTKTDLAFKKPGNGIPAAQYEFFIGKSARSDIKKNDYLSYESIVGK